MDGKGKKHTCPGCGLPLIAEAVGTGDDLYLELHYDGDAEQHAAAAESAVQQRIDAAVAEAREQWISEHQPTAAARTEEEGSALLGIV